jgi:hypothetical protein
MKLKSYSQYLFESRGGLVQTILDASEDTISKMVAQSETFFIKEFKRPFSKFDLEMTRLYIIADMVKSIEGYTQPTDKLVTLHTGTSRKGNLEISAQIEREGQVYRLSTEAIIAGGYNIQRAHYRYLTNTNLPRTGRSELTKLYTAEIKKMTKAEKINTEIQALERDIERSKKIVAENSPLTDEQIIQILKDANEYAFNMPSWEQIIKNGAAKNYNNSEEEYNASTAKYQASKIDFWKTQNIKWPSDRIKSLEKSLAKERAKLEALL